MGYAAPLGRGGPIAHGSPLMTGRVSNPAPMRFGGVPQRRAPYTGAEHSGTGRSGWNQGDRDGDGDHDRDGDRDHRRRPYYRGYGLGLSYGYLGWPGYPFLWSGYPLFGNDAATFNDYDRPYGTHGNPPDYGDAMQQYPGYPAAPAPDTYGYGGEGSRSGDSEAEGARASYTGPVEVDPPAPQQAVTVIFKDGRPPEQIHNYLLTATTLTVLDQRYRQIPVDQIDVNATRQSNLADGIDFRVPGGSR